MKKRFFSLKDNDVKTLMESDLNKANHEFGLNETFQNILDVVRTSKGKSESSDHLKRRLTGIKKGKDVPNTVSTVAKFLRGGD